MDDPGGIEIGLATDNDREWCARLMAASEPWVTLGRDLEECRLACRRRGYALRVARQAGTPCGFILLHPRGLAGSPYIASVAVDPTARGRGIGTVLMDYAETVLAAGARNIFLCVSSFNVDARRLYERRGYSAVGELKDYIIAGASETIMQKRLPRP